MLWLKSRILARRVSKKVQAKLLSENPQTLPTDKGYVLVLDDEKFVVEITIRRFRLFDGIHVWHEGAEVWLPLLQRIRLRNSVRIHVASRAL